MNLGQFAGKLGELPPSVGLPWVYFASRGCFLDCRGPLVIHAKTYWGIRVTVITQSHKTDGGPGHLGPIVPYGVTVEEGAWVGSHALLLGCHIGAGSIVAAGSVVRGQTVAPGVMVAGNPARAIARWKDGAWVYFRPLDSGYQRMLA